MFCILIRDLDLIRITVEINEMINNFETPYKYVLRFKCHIRWIHKCYANIKYPMQVKNISFVYCMSSMVKCQTTSYRTFQTFM